MQATEKLGKALEIIDQIDTRTMTWEESDEKLHQVQGLVKEAKEALEPRKPSRLSRYEQKRLYGAEPEWRPAPANKA